MRSSRQSSLLAEFQREDVALSSIKGQDEENHQGFLAPQQDDADTHDVPPTFRGHPDRPN